jgi:hypothetical protein
MPVTSTGMTMGGAESSNENEPDSRGTRPVMTNEDAESLGGNKPDNCGLRPHPHRAVGPVYPFPFSPRLRLSIPTSREGLIARPTPARGRGPCIDWRDI